MRPVLPWGLLALALGCSFDASGITESGSSNGVTASGGAVDPTGSGDAGSSGGETTAPGSSGAVEPVTTSASDTGQAATTELSTTSASDPSTGEAPGSTGGPPDESTGGPSCPQPYKQIVLVADAMVIAPMEKSQSMMGEGTVAFSSKPEMGIVNFPVAPPCAGPVAVWARVQDLEEGIHDKDPDSFYTHADNDGEAAWLYGCQTFGMPVGYHWLRVRTGVPGEQCDTYTDWSPQLGAGDHVISLRNREGQSGMAVAAVARLLVTSDFNYVPTGND